MMFPGYVPQNGQYNQTYIEKIDEIVKLSAKYGIYTLLDMHQDVFSPKFCVEGMPDWMVDVGEHSFSIRRREESVLCNIRKKYNYS